MLYMLVRNGLFTFSVIKSSSIFKCPLETILSYFKINFSFSVSDEKQRGYGCTETAATQLLLRIF